MIKLFRAADYNSMSRKAANIISAQVILKPDCVLGLATGASPVGIYKQLIAWFKQGDLDFAACRSVNLDEYVGLTAEDAQSYACFMRRNFFDHVNLDPANIYIPRGDDADAERECRRYNRVIRQLGGIDVQLLGIGHNGHVGFNEPGVAFEKETHCVELSRRTIEANARFFGPGELQPTRAYTMGIKSIMNARRILLVACGADKADILHQALCGPISPEVPASILQLHSNVTVIADEAAAKLLPETL